MNSDKFHGTVSYTSLLPSPCITLEPLNHPHYDKIIVDKFWKYDEEWFKKKVEGRYDLDKICRHNNARFTIEHYVTHNGQKVLDLAKKLNKNIDKINSISAEDSASSDVEKILDSLRLLFQLDPEELLSDLENVNYELAPETVLEAVKKTMSLDFHVYNLRQRIEKDLRVFYSVLREKEVEAARAASERQMEEYLAKHEKKMKEYMERRQLKQGEIIELTHVKVKEGFVYILSNSWMKNVYKIGFTSRNPDERAKEVSKKIGLPEPFRVVNYWRTNDPYIVEQRIFEKLSSYRLDSSNEFFSVDIEVAVEAIEKCLIAGDE